MATQCSILLLDKRTEPRATMAAHLGGLGYQGHEAAELAAGVAALNPVALDLVILRPESIARNDLTLWEQLKARFPHLYGILVADDCERIKPRRLREAFDICLPADTPSETLAILLGQAREMIGLRKERLALSQQQAHQDHFFHSLLDATSEAVVVISPDFDIQFGNAAFERLLNLPDRTLSGRKLHPFLDDGFKVLHHINHQLTVGKHIHGYRIALKPEHSEKVDVSLSADFLYSSEGYVEGIILVMESGTLQNAVFKELVRKERLLAIQELADALAHEIHNPVNILSGRVQLLEKAIKGGEHGKSFDIVNRQIERISSTIGQLQRFNLNRDDTVPEIFPIMEFLEEFVGRREGLEGIVYQLRYPENARDILIQANPYQIEDALTYLFRTIDRLAPRNSTVKVNGRLLRTFSDNPCVEIQIDYNQDGASEDLFDAQHRVTPNDRYSLLDLALVQTIVSHYGGSIFMERLFGTKKQLRLQFGVAGVRSPNSATTQTHRRIATRD